MKLKTATQQFLIWKHNKSDQVGYDTTIRKKTVKTCQIRVVNVRTHTTAAAQKAK